MSADVERCIDRFLRRFVFVIVLPSDFLFLCLIVILLTFRIHRDEPRVPNCR